MRPKDIVKGMKLGNFEYTGSVGLSGRVSNELYNLKKTGKILRRKSGLYHLKQEEGL